MSNILMIFLYGIIVLAFTLVYYSTRLYLKKKNLSHIPGPKFKGIIGFYFGNLIDALSMTRQGKMFPVFVEDCFREYGSLFKLQLFNRFIVYTMEPDIIKECLIEKDFRKHPSLYKQIGYPLGHRFLGNGLITETDNEKWKCRRHVFQPMFNKKLIEDFVDKFDVLADQFLVKLRNLTNKKGCINLRVELNDVVLDIISNLTFGIDMNGPCDAKKELHRNINLVLEGLIECFKDPLIKLKPHKWNFMSELRNSIKFIRDLARKLILQRIDDIKSKDYIPSDLLSYIVISHDSSDTEIETMIDDFVTFFIASKETTVYTLIFCFIELANNRDVHDKVKKEIDEVLGSNPKITYNDVNKLEYTGNVLKETLRKWPVVPSINRLVPFDIELNGFKIPKDTEICFSSYCVGRNPKYYPDPLEFKPERFEIDPVTNKNSIIPYTYFPFSLGPRNCLGQNFARIHTRVLLAKIIQSFDFELQPGQSIEVIYDGNLKPKNDVYFNFKEKSIL